MSKDYIRIQLSQLRPGSRLRAPIYDGKSDRQKLLLAAGVQITTSQLELLRRRGITEVLIHRNDLDSATDHDTVEPPMSAATPMRSTPSRNSTARDTGLPSTWKQGANSFLHEVQRPVNLQSDPAVVRQIQRAYETSISTTKNVFEDFAQDGKINSSAVTCVAEQQLEQASQDLDAFVFIGLQPVTEGYPSRHSVQTAMLATSIGTIMGLNKYELVELSAGCLIHDAGMMLVPPQILQHQGALSTSERLELMKHPLHIANALNSRNDIPHGVKATAYQIHERMNGSGYPRKRMHPQIHLFARIGAVADTYLAMVSPRNGRMGLTPYEAVEKLLYATRMGLFDPTVVRALLHVASLFPVGSIVTLSDGRAGRVSRANREHYDRPVIEIVTSEWETSHEIIDLSEQGSLRIVSAGELMTV